MTSVATNQTKEPLSVQLRREVSRRILLGDYAQGEVLTEERIAADLDVSRVPVREAMPYLARQGLIETAPRRRSVVTTWTAQTVNDLFDTRLGLEIAATGSAARRARAGGTDLAEVERALELSERLLATGGGLPLAESNTQVHLMIAKASGNALMYDLIQTLTSRMTWLFYLTSSRDLQTQSHEHHVLLDALRAGNDRLAESIMLMHIEAGRQPSLEAVARASAE